MAKDKEMGSHIGRWAFLIGVILCVVIALFSWLGWGTAIVQSSGMTAFLIILGLVVGFLNITDREVTPFLWSGAVLVIVASMGQSVMGNVVVVDNILQALLVLFIPATIIVAVKNVFALAKN